jgi:hypothetical protein
MTRSNFFQHFTHNLPTVSHRQAVAELYVLRNTKFLHSKDFPSSHVLLRRGNPAMC